MTYIVTWSASAIAELNRIEQAAPDRESFRQSPITIYDECPKTWANRETGTSEFGTAMRSAFTTSSIPTR
jgi:hypothetical protein